jgi:selenocysteine lyase/cysteine desulfurase
LVKTAILQINSGNPTMVKMNNTQNPFALSDDLIYLNHAAVSPWPLCTAETVKRFAEENARLGASNYLQWMDTERQLRDNLAWLINAPSVDDIAIQKSTSEALSAIAHGLDWQAGQNVVFLKQEFPSNRVVWQSLEHYGVTARMIDPGPGQEPEAALLAACDNNTRLISVSSVQYASGLRMDLLRIGEYANKNNVLFCVDAIQSLGALAFDVAEVGADFVVADGHKWMLGPEGVALLYTDKRIRERLMLHQFGWHMLETAGDFDTLAADPASSGRRFECGSPNMLGIHALNSSLSLIREIGLERISADILRNTDLLVRLIADHPRLELLSSAKPERRSGIVTFKVPGEDQERLYRELMRRRVICAARGGGIRFSPHFYTGEQKLGDALGILEQILNSKTD